MTPSRSFSSASSIRPAIKRQHYPQSVSLNSFMAFTEPKMPNGACAAKAFVEELLAAVVAYPLSIDMARVAGKLDAEQQSRGVVIPFADLLRCDRTFGRLLSTQCSR